MMKKNREKAGRFSVGQAIICLVMLVVFLLPFWIILVSSFSDNTRLQAEGISLWFKGFTLEGYKFVLQMSEVFLSSLWFSVWTSVLSAALSTVVSFLAAYALSRKYFVGRKFLNLFIMFTMFFSGGQIPTYLVIRQLGMYNTPLAFILPGVATAYNIMLMRNYFYGIPQSLDEAAHLDGASDFQILTKVYVPLSKTVAFTVFFMSLVIKWNAWLPSLLYAGAQNDKLWTIQYVLNQIINDAQAMFGGGSVSTAPLISATYAAVIMVVLPLVIVAPLVQKFFVVDATGGAVKE